MLLNALGSLWSISYGSSWLLLDAIGSSWILSQILLVALECSRIFLDLKSLDSIQWIPPSKESVDVPIGGG